MLTRARHDRIDEAYRELQRHFNAEQIAQLTVTAAQINAWNRIGIAQHIEGTAVGIAA